MRSFPKKVTCLLFLGKDSRQINSYKVLLRYKRYKRYTFLSKDMRFLPSGVALFAKMGSCLSAGAEPVLELVHPLLAVAKMEVGAPSMSAFWIENEGGADAVVE